jgi:hypothetical protein
LFLRLLDSKLNFGDSHHWQWLFSAVEIYIYILGGGKKEKWR